MKPFLMMFVMVFASMGLMVADADAAKKRFGGGDSVGKQRSVDAQSAQKTADATPASTTGATNGTAATQKKSDKSKWLGPLAGLALGAGLMALLSGMGLDGMMGGILMMLLLAAVVLFIFAMWRKRLQATSPAMQYAAATAQPQPAGASSTASSLFANNMSGGSSTTGQAQAQPQAAPLSIPADFPVNSFLRSAKTSFIRLQAANDSKDLNDVREYSTPQMFAEISMQFQERDDSPQRTDVLNIQPQLLEVVTEGELAIASVHFTGQIRCDGETEQVDEIWHVQKEVNDDKAVWLLAGIQQTQVH